MLAGFVNPAMYIFDLEKLEAGGGLEVKHRLPYSDLESLSAEERRRPTKKDARRRYP